MVDKTEENIQALQVVASACRQVKATADEHQIIQNALKTLQIAISQKQENEEKQNDK